MVQFGQALGQSVSSVGTGAVIFLHGDLGMGKTTLCRGVLGHFGHSGAVKSPTYTLVEPYELAERSVYHFDLYRLGDPEELEFFGIRDYFDDVSVCLIEWPEKGEGVLASADLELSLVVEGEGRQISWQANTPRGQQLSAALEGAVNN